jgi:hypothetical protein
VTAVVIVGVVLVAALGVLMLWIARALNDNDQRLDRIERRSLTYRGQEPVG